MIDCVSSPVSERELASRDNAGLDIGRMPSTPTLTPPT